LRPILSRPCGTESSFQIQPRTASWAKFNRPCGTKFVNPSCHTPSKALISFGSMRHG